MRGAIVQIQNTNVHTPRPMRGAIPRAQNLRFATVSRDRPTESYERVHPAKSKCAFRYSGVPSKMWECTFRYSGVHRNVWNERIASAVARGIQKSSFHHSFERPTSTKWRKGSPSSRGLAGVTYKFTVKMKSTWSPRAIYTVYTTISPGLAGVTYKFTVKMKPTRNLYGIHNDFCGVGGGLRRGCILIRNRDGVGWGGVKFLHIERKITSVVHSHPPSHYIRKHASGWRHVMFTTRRTRTTRRRISRKPKVTC